MADIITEIDGLKRKVEKAKTARANLEGRKDELTKRLKQEYKVDNLEQARELLKEIDEEIRIAEERIESTLKRIKDKLGS